MSLEELQKQSCPNQACQSYGKVGVNSIKVHDAGRKRLRCANCGKTWKSYINEPHYGLRVQKTRVERAFQMVKAGLSIREIAKYSNVSPSTIMRWKNRIKALENVVPSDDILVLKFGGTSVATPASIKAIKGILFDVQQRNKKMAVVVSAFGGVTDQLIKIAQLASNNNDQHSIILQELELRHLETVKDLLPVKDQSPVLARVRVLLNELEDVLHGISLIRELSKKSLDLVMSFGERLSAYIISQFLKAEGINSRFIDARDILETDSRFNAASVNFQQTNKNIHRYFKDSTKLSVITGFIGSNNKGETTTLGRGGSDYTAAIFAAALNAREIQIWTDVDGVLTANPKQVRNAFPLESLSYIEAMEMSHFGAKVIHPPTLRPAMKKNIPIRILNTFNPTFPGTYISAEIEKSKHTAKGISSINEVSLVTLAGSGLVGLCGASNRLFGALAQHNINIILISQASSEHTICFAIKPNETEKAKQAIEQEFKLEIKEGDIDEVIIEENLAIIALVGEGMKHRTGVAGKLFSALGRNGISAIAIAQGSSEFNISVVIKNNKLKKALNVVHDAFFLAGQKSINLFLMGTGLVGSTLIEQVFANTDFLSDKKNLNIQLIGLANSKKMAFDECGIEFLGALKTLKSGEEMGDCTQFVERMKDLNLANSVFIDCTASEDVAAQYSNILKSSISIVTPNKKAMSGKFSDYKKLKKLSLEKDVNYFFETNVGAGLPVLSTINDLILSGDSIQRIEAVLSGTLSYIFNTYDGSVPFSEVVKEAKEKGFTEPDPRDDLNGMDVARKILILARESEYKLEIDDIVINPLINPACENAKSVKDFFVQLKKMDSTYKSKFEKAKKDNKVLRYIASFEGGKAKVSLQAVEESHPFYSLSQNDNIISFTTDRYCNRPLVIKGPGAGAAVTAAGVFADIIRISN